MILVLFLFIPILLLATFTYYPAFYLVYLSFVSWDGLDLHKKWIGLANYENVFHNADILRALKHNLIYLLLGIPQQIIPLFFAVILNMKLRGRNMFRSIMFFPYMINSVAIGFMFTYVLHSQIGAVNTLLRSMNLDFMALNWMTDPNIVTVTISTMAFWKSMGFLMVIFLGALQSIPTDIYEAAGIDGASGYQQFRYITLPSIRHIIELTLFLNIAGALQMFEFPFILFPSKSPNGMTDTFVTLTYHTAFMFNDYGLASAMGIVLMIIVAFIVTVQRFVVFRGNRE